VIVPETIVCDHGMVYMSHAFRSACRAMGINLQPSHKGSPWEKGTVETSFSSVGTLFAQYVAGYVGNSVENRGEKAEQGAAWSMIELQELLDAWIVTCWQNRPHEGLRHPLAPGRAMTPNEQYAALIEIAGYVPIPLSEADYIELLPATWRAINAYGMKIGHRRYDCAELTPYRRQHSTVAAKKGLWEVHFDPYDVSRVWVRNHHDGGWICAPWTHLRGGPAPFGEQAWEHARRILARRGQGTATEQEIAQAVDALLDTAGTGPERPATDRRVAGRTRATTQARPQRHHPAPDRLQQTTPDTDDALPIDGELDEFEDDHLAEVIPLGIFDAREEAKKWW
jgi:putative transposase